MHLSSALIEQIYEAAFAPERWPVVLGSVAAHVGAVSAALMLRPEDRMRLAGATPERAIPPSPAGSCGGSTKAKLAVPAREAEPVVLRIEVKPLRRTQPERRSSARPQADSVLQVVTASAEPCPAMAAQLEVLRPHLARALSLSMRMTADRAATMVAGLAAMGVGAAIIDRDGRLRCINAHFERRLAGAIDDRTQRLRFPDPSLQSQLEAALAIGCDGREVRSIAPRMAASDVPYTLHLLPLPGGLAWTQEGGCRLLTVAEGRPGSMPSPDLLRLLFDLTRAEARLAHRLVEGQTIAELAAALNISEQTARYHLKAVFAKTGTHRQVDLVIRLHGLGPPPSEG